MATLADFLALTETYGRNAAPPPAPEMDLRSMLMFAGPTIMAAAGKPGASFGGSVGEGMMTGMQFAERRREREEARQRQAHTDALARLEMSTRMLTASQKEAKPLSFVDIEDPENPGKKIKVGLNPTTGQQVARVGSLPSEANWQLGKITDAQGREINVAFNPKTRETMPLGGPKGDKPPEGMAWADPSDPSKGLVPIPGYIENKAALENAKPFNVPEGGARYPGIAPTYAAGVKGFENTTGDPAARNPRSTAMGDGQFLKGTWLDLWPRLAPQVAPILQQRGIDPSRLTSEEILALRAVPEIAEAGTNLYAAENAPKLQRATGQAPTRGQTQLAHFLGPDGAISVLTADPSAPIERVVGPEAFAANREVLAGKTAGQVARMFDRGQGVANAPGQAQAGTLRPIAERAPSSRFERAYDQEEGKALAKERGEIAEAAKSGRETIAQANALQTLLEQTGTGKTVPLTTGMKAWAKSVGVDLEALGFRDNVATAEAASRIAREISLKFIQQTKGAISNAEMQVFLEMVPTLSNTPEGNRILLDAMRAVAKRQVDIDRAARAYETRPDGRFDRGFADQLEAIFARNPILPPDIQQRAQAPAAAPAPERAQAPAPRGAASRTEPAGQGSATAGQGGDLPRRPDGNVDRTKLIEGRIYTTPQGRRFRYRDTTFEEVP